MDELISKLRKWAPIKRKELLFNFGIINEKDETILFPNKNKDFQQDMQQKFDNEEDEWEYVKQKYFPDSLFTNNDNEGTKKDNNNNVAT